VWPGIGQTLWPQTQITTTTATLTTKSLPCKQVGKIDSPPPSPSPSPSPSLHLDNDAEGARKER